MSLRPFIASGIGLGAVYALAIVGLVILYRASGTLNFAFGAFGGVAAFLAWQLGQDGVPAPIGWIAGVAVSTGLAYGYGRVFAPRLAHRDRVVRAVATLGLALFLFGGMALYWGIGVARRLVLPTDLNFVVLFGVRLSYTRLIALGLSLVMAGGVGLFLSRTRIGLAMRALASDRHISAAIGVRVTQIDSLAWLVNGFFAGIAGILLANIARREAGTLTFLVHPAFVAAGRLHRRHGRRHDRGIVDGIVARNRQSAQRRALHRRLAVPHDRRHGSRRRGARMTEISESAALPALAPPSTEITPWLRAIAIVVVVGVVSIVIALTCGGYW